MARITSSDRFANRHIGPSAEDVQAMLDTIGLASLDELIDQTVPENIRRRKPLELPAAETEYEFLRKLKELAARNKVFKSYIGQGYYGTITPSVILRNIFHNPGWYTQYTPYQAEIAQGRLEALLTFQTMVSDLTGLPMANASLLDEATAAAEAMLMCHHVRNKRVKGEPINEFLVDERVFPQTLDVLRTRAEAVGIRILTGRWQDFRFTEKTLGLLVQYPDARGEVHDFRELTARAGEAGVMVVVAADIMSLALLTPPGEWGADVVVGSTQRFGVPMGYGGPHAAYFATREEYKRQIPGRIIGVSVDREGHKAFRMALQTREQHIKREKATSNICTAQALLAIMAGMYAVYHGAEGIRAIAERIHAQTQVLDRNLKALGYRQTNAHYFDTLRIEVDAALRQRIQHLALNKQINLFYDDVAVQVSLDETTRAEDLRTLIAIFAEAKNAAHTPDLTEVEGYAFPEALVRTTPYLTHPVFSRFRTETQMMRYIKRLEGRDLSLTHSMIPLGSCTMKLNAATELLPLSWPEFADLHPFVPADQAQGYRRLFRELEQYLCEITDLAACSLQPNSGAQGEYTGLMVIRAYHRDRGEGHRNITLIPSSAHGTNPASAVMAGMKVVVVACDAHGNIDLDDLRAKAEQYKDTLAALMITYPSTHGVFEKEVVQICDIVHRNGGLVYMDGANMNAQVGLTSPGIIGADVCHLNLHKTFAIPHGGGGPGMGPICVNEKLAPYLPKHPLVQEVGGDKGISAVSAAPWGSASILVISYAYIRLMGPDGLTEATRHAILNANYIAARLQARYNVLYRGENGRVAHELIVDLRPYKAIASAEDVAKRLMDYGFHAPTVSFPVPGTLMIEPTESEDKEELDRFCEAMLRIREEIDEVARGEQDAEDNVLHNAPHTAQMVTADEWHHAYSRAKAAWPAEYLRHGHKFWPPVARVDNAYGDRHLVCVCPPIEEYMD